MKFLNGFPAWAVLIAMLIVHLPAQAAGPIKLEDIWASGKYLPKGINSLRSMQDGEHYTQLIRTEKGQQVIQCSYASGDTVAVLFSTQKVKSTFPELDIESYHFSSNEDYLLLTGSSIPVYRRSKKVKAYLYNLEEEVLFPVRGGEHVMSPSVSPGGAKVAFVQDNNIYYQDFYPQPGMENAEANVGVAGKDSGVVYQVTEDGRENAVINGQADWVYEEEFSLVQAYEWSPDGRYIAYLKFDESDVPLYRMHTYYDQSYPNLYEYKYPKAGEDPAYVSAHLYTLKGMQTRDLKLPHDSDSYLPRLRWSTIPNQLVIHHLNRPQKKLQLFFIDAQSGEAEVRYSESDRSYINLNDELYFLENGDFILLSSKRSYGQVYMYKNDGTFKNQIVRGRYDVTDILHIDEDKRTIYYQTAEVSPLERHIYKAPFSGRRSSIERLSMQAGTHDAQFSANGAYMVHTYSSATQPPVYRVLRTRDTTELRILEDNQALKETWRSLELADKEFFEMRGARGKDLNGWIIKPRKTGMFKKYPVLVNVYGGPGSQSVKDAWSSYNDIYFHYLANQKGIVVVCLDNRGTGGQGDRFEKSVYRELGVNESEDQAEVVEFLETLNYVDPERLGIFGWSYGGYLASMCLMRFPEVFDCAVAVAPVTDWRFYDNIYTERYMGTPQNNKDGYKESALFEYLPNMKGDYLLIHGTFDDNVHPQHSYELIKQMVQLDIPFDSEFYTNKNHGIYGGMTRLHLFRRITEFLETALAK